MKYDEGGRQHTSSLAATMISAVLLDRVRNKLGLARWPKHDLAGLNEIYAAYSCRVPNDNIQKRIWLSGDKSRPVSGGDPIEFFENWLEHGTGARAFLQMAAFMSFCARSALMQVAYWAR